jgi:hypothetical protein
MKDSAKGAQKLVLVFLLLLVGTNLVPSGISAQATPQAPAAAPATTVAAQAASPAPQQPQMVCGNSSMCYEANDFAATITSFRTSTQSYLKIIDIIVRFQNKTNASITLGYVSNSGTATDDRGNRYGVWGANGFRGIGLVNGNTFDPRFTLRPGGFGDAQFELAWNPGQAVYGLTFQVDLTVDEINTVEGNQHTLGGEFPLHFQGLANGTGGSSPAVASLMPATGGSAATVGGNAVAAAGNPAAAAGSAATSATQAGCNTANQTGAAAAAANVANTVSSIGSLFGKKKPAAQNTAQTPNSSGPCDQANNKPQTPAANAAQAPPPAAAPTPAANTASPASAKPAPAAARPMVPTTTAPAK